MNLKQLYLITSNQNKLNEYQRFGLSNLNCKKGPDIKEVQSDDITVAIYKSKDMGENSIIEDTSLEIENADIGTNIRWKLDEISKYDGYKAIWGVILAVNYNGFIFLYKGIQEGLIDSRYKDKQPNDAFGFDPYFRPLNTELTLYDLEKTNQKDNFSARKKAIEQLIKNEPIQILSIDSIPIWTGKYQS